MCAKNRKKASDIFNETNFLFSKKVLFKEAFPGIESISVIVKEYENAGQKPDDGLGLYPKTYIFNNSRLPSEYIDCSNIVCYNGGFSLGSVLRDMVLKKEALKEGKSFCQGYEGSPKGNRRYRSCIHRFEYKIEIIYKISKQTT